MSSNIPDNSGKHTEKSEVVFMNAVAGASSLLRRVAEPRPVGDSVKQAINRAARRVSRFLPSPMGYSRAEGIWRQEARAIRAEEMDAIRRAAADRTAREAKNEFAELRARIARLEEAIRIQDEDLYGVDADALHATNSPPNRTLD